MKNYRCGMLLFVLVCITFSNIYAELVEEEKPEPLPQIEDSIVILSDSTFDATSPVSVLEQLKKSNTTGLFGTQLEKAIFNTCTEIYFNRHHTSPGFLQHTDSLLLLIKRGEYFMYEALRTTNEHESLLLKSIGAWWLSKAGNYLEETLAEKKYLMYEEDYQRLTGRLIQDRFAIKMPPTSNMIKTFDYLLRGEYKYVAKRFWLRTGWLLKVGVLFIFSMLFYLFYKGVYITIKSIRNEQSCVYSTTYN